MSDSKRARVTRSPSPSIPQSSPTSGSSPSATTSSSSSSSSSRRRRREATPTPPQYQHLQQLESDNDDDDDVYVSQQQRRSNEKRRHGHDHDHHQGSSSSLSSLSSTSPSSRTNSETYHDHDHHHDDRYAPNDYYSGDDSEIPRSGGYRRDHNGDGIMDKIQATLKRLRHIYRHMRGPVRDQRAHRRRWQYAAIFAGSVIGLTVIKLTIPPPQQGIMHGGDTITTTSPSSSQHR
jgi:hypothetical protein